MNGGFCEFSSFDNQKLVKEDLQELNVQIKVLFTSCVEKSCYFCSKE